MTDRKKPVIRAAKNRRRVDKMNSEGVLTIFHRGTEDQAYRISPQWTREFGPHIMVCRTGKGEVPAKVIITLDAVNSIVRSLPLIATFARRLEPPKEQST